MKIVRVCEKLALLQQFLHQQETNVDITLMVASSEDNFTVTELNCFSDLINLVTLGYGFSFFGYTQFSLSKGLSGK